MKHFDGISNGVMMFTTDLGMTVQQEGLVRTAEPITVSVSRGSTHANTIYLDLEAVFNNPDVAAWLDVDHAEKVAKYILEICAAIRKEQGE